METEAPTPSPVFCCHGCELAYEIVQGAGLERWYQERQAPAPRPGALASGWAAVPVGVDRDGSSVARVQIDGLQCASCVWVTERVLQATPGVRAASLSYASGRAELRWDPAQVDLDTLAGRVAALGYRPRAVDQAAPDWDHDLLVRLGVAIFSAMNVMALTVAVYLGWASSMEERYATLFRWISLVLATPVALWSVSLAIGVLYLPGLAATLAGQDAYLDSLCMLVALLLGGRVIEQRGRRRAADAARALAAQAPRQARRREARGAIVEVPSATLAVGDQIVVGQGEEIAADGRVLEGEGRVQMALLTGESEPVVVQAGALVVAGGVLVQGSLVVEVEAAGEEAMLARMIRGLGEAADRPAEARITDRIAPWFTGAVLSVAALSALLWGIFSGLDAALALGVAVMVVACPCALSLAWPMATSAGLGAAARRGLLVRSGDALLALERVDTVLLDKTGTLTGGQPVVVDAEDAVLRIAAGIEAQSIHPIARAIVAEAGRRGLALPCATQVVEVAGKGICGVIDGRSWEIRAGRTGKVEVVGLGDILLQDVVRADALATVEALQAAGMTVMVITGDKPEVAARVGLSLGLGGDLIVAAASPEEKASRVRTLQAAGHRVLFVGDGLNDGPALAAADVGLAMGSGAASSVLVADAILATHRVGPILAGLRAGRAAHRAVRRNMRRSIAYNLLAVVAASAGLVNPLVAALFMPLSSASVVVESLWVERNVRRAERSRVPTPPSGLSR